MISGWALRPSGWHWASSCLRLHSSGSARDVRAAGACGSWLRVCCTQGRKRAAEAAISGPGSGYEYPDDADTLLLVGDETAIPAITQLIEMAPGVSEDEVAAKTTAHYAI